MIAHQERNILNQGFAITGSMSAQILESVEQFYAPLMPLFLIALALIFVDSRFGSLKSKLRGEEVRFSRMIRKSINKFVDYFCWVTLAGLFGAYYGDAFNLPNLELVALAGIYGIELNSIMNNFLEYKGINIKFNFLKWFGRKTDTSEMFEEYDRTKHNTNSSKDNGRPRKNKAKSGI